MELEFKPDFDEARERWDALWSGRKLPRPLLQMVVGRPGHKPVSPPYPIRPDGDISAVIEQTLAWAAGHEFLGEAFPYLTLEFGPEHFAALLGAEMRYHEASAGTGWVVPFVDDWDDVEIRPRRDGWAWRRTVEFIRAMRAACDGKVLIDTPVLSAGLDALSAIRGPERLLVDLVERPEAIARAQADVRRAYHEVVEELAVELGWEQLGSGTWLGLYHRGRVNTIQCDFSCMIGPRMFEEVELPSLVHQAGHFDAVAYHLDGPGAVKHLDAVCTIENLALVQYVPVPRESPAEIDAVYRKIDALGRGCHRHGDAETVRRAWGESSTRRAVFNVRVPSRRAAERLIESF